MQSIIQPKKPRNKDWQQVHEIIPALEYLNCTYNVYYYLKQQLKVVSALEVVDRNIGPEYHLSISKNGGRCDSNAAKWVLDQFDLNEAEEDNHVPGGHVRNFWRPVADKFVGMECECKDTEPVMKEDKGDYIWRGFNK